MSPALLQFAADAVLVAHFALVVFVVGGLPLILVGNRCGWAWVNSFGFRIAHLAAIAVVVAEAWLGISCPLTTLENALRAAAGSEAYARSFVEHWVQRLLYHDAPAWVFIAAYTAFGLLVAAAWWRYPPRRQ